MVYANGESENGGGDVQDTENGGAKGSMPGKIWKLNIGTKMCVPLWAVATVLVFAYRCLLDVFYFYFVTVHFSYYGHVDHRTELNLCFSWLMIFFTIPFIRQWVNARNERGSTDVIFFIYLFAYIPFSTGVYAGVISYSCFFFGTIYFFMLFVLQYFCCRRIPSKYVHLLVGVNKINHIILWICVLCTAFIIVNVWFWYADARLINPFGREIYSIRAEAGEYRLPLFARYFVSAASLVLSMPLAYFWKRRQFMGSLVLWFILLMRFNIDAMKTDFFLPLAVLVIAKFHKHCTRAYFRVSILAAFTAFVICGIGESFIRMGNIGIIENYFIRRMLFTPVALDEAYYQFFSMNTPDWFQGSFLRHFGFSSMYASLGGVHQAIGNYLGHPTLVASNGLFSDAMANLGIAGIGFMPIVIVLILILFDYCTFGIDGGLVVGGAFLLAMRLIPAAIGSALLSYGILPMMAMMMLMDRKTTRESAHNVEV